MPEYWNANQFLVVLKHHVRKLGNYDVNQSQLELRKQLYNDLTKLCIFNENMLKIQVNFN